MIALRQLLLQQNIKSVAIPPLGSGNGGLDWKRVKPMIEQALSGLDTVIMIYEPNAAIKTILQKQETKRDVHLTPARAALLYTLFIFFLSFLIGEIFLLNLLIHQ